MVIILFFNFSSYQYQFNHSIHSLPTHSIINSTQLCRDKSIFYNKVKKTIITSCYKFESAGKGHKNIIDNVTGVNYFVDLNYVLNFTVLSYISIILYIWQLL